MKILVQILLFVSNTDIYLIKKKKKNTDIYNVIRAVQIIMSAHEFLYNLAKMKNPL